MENKKIIGFVIGVLALAVLLVEGGIAKSLLDNGYSLEELPGASKVFFHISRGFTVGSADDGKTSVFIGRSKNTYGDYFADKGYKSIYDYDGAVYYGKNGKESDFWIKETDVSCIWFTVYEISADYPIESFK